MRNGEYEDMASVIMECPPDPEKSRLVSSDSKITIRGVQTARVNGTVTRAREIQRSGPGMRGDFVDMVGCNWVWKHRQEFGETMLKKQRKPSFSRPYQLQRNHSDFRGKTVPQQ